MATEWSACCEIGFRNVYKINSVVGYSACFYMTLNSRGDPHNEMAF